MLIDSYQKKDYEQASHWYVESALRGNLNIVSSFDKVEGANEYFLRRDIESLKRSLVKFWEKQ